jgi:hypothetical protein
MSEHSQQTVQRPLPITCLAVLYFACVTGIVVLLITDLTVLVVPRSLIFVLCFVAGSQLILGRGLWKLRNWARVATAILSAFFAVPSVFEILLAFHSFDIAKLIINLLLVTLDGMIVAYLVHSETRRVFEEPRIELHLN